MYACAHIPFSWTMMLNSGNICNKRKHVYTSYSHRSLDKISLKFGEQLTMVVLLIPSWCLLSYIANINWAHCWRQNSMHHIHKRAPCQSGVIIRGAGNVLNITNLNICRCYEPFFLNLNFCAITNHCCQASLVKYHSNAQQWHPKPSGSWYIYNKVKLCVPDNLSSLSHCGLILA